MRDGRQIGALTSTTRMEVMRWGPELALQSLEACRKRYREICEFLPWGHLVLDESGRIEEINPAAARLLGAVAADLYGASLQAYLSDACVGPLLDNLAQARATSGKSEGHLELSARDGHIRHVELHTQWFKDLGKPHYHIALQDVTETRSSHLALRRIADEMRDLYQNAPCGYHSIDADAVVIQINDTELRWLGYRRDEVTRKLRLTDLMPLHCRGDFDNAFAALKEQGRVRDVQVEMRRKDGSTFPALLSATAVKDSRGQFLESRASMFDITRRRLAEDEAQRYAQRLKAMSRRAVEIQETERRHLAQELHDRVGQNLTALNINLNIMKGQLSPVAASIVGTRLDDSLSLVEATVDSIRDVMAELRPAVLDDYGLGAVLRWYAEDFSRRTGVSTSVVGNDPTPRLASATEGTLFRIVQESLTNVAKHARAQQATVMLESHPGRFCLSITDDGCGFDSSGIGQPTDHHGWGLMIMRERAESTGGQLRVESTMGHGTRVVVELGV
jgi:PAS domain S-box-containing protein